MPTLFSWSVRAHGPVFLAHGVVSGHHRLPEGEHVHTSYIRCMIQEEDDLLLETASGSIYQLALGELDPFAGGPELPLPLPEELGLSPDLWERCAQAREQASKKEEEALRALNAPGTLRLRIVGVTALSALWIGQDGAVHSIPIHVHLGMFQDSVLVTGFFEVDFRYFPYPGRIEPYKVAPAIQALQIVNEGLQDVSIGHTGQTVLCTAGKTTWIAVGHDGSRPPLICLS